MNAHNCNIAHAHTVRIPEYIAFAADTVQIVSPVHLTLYWPAYSIVLHDAVNVTVVSASHIVLVLHIYIYIYMQIGALVCIQLQRESNFSFFY